MSSVTGGKNPIVHLPISPGSGNVTIPVVAGTPGGTRSLSQTTSGGRSLIIAGTTVAIDLTKHGPMNVVDIINNANIPGVVASLDRYGQLVINGVSSVSGDALLLQHLGFA
jgi:hypothetical protein